MCTAFLIIAVVAPWYEGKENGEFKMKLIPIAVLVGWGVIAWVDGYDLTTEESRASAAGYCLGIVAVWWFLFVQTKPTRPS